MSSAGVLVSCSVAGSGPSTRYSGILLGNKWVLTTGSILSNVLSTISSVTTGSPVEDLLKTAHPGSLVHVPNKFPRNAQISFSVLCPSEFATNNVLENHVVASKSNAVNKSLMKPVPKVTEPVPFSANYRGIFQEYKSQLRYIWKSPFVSEAMDSLFSSWVLGSTSSCKEDSDKDAESEIAKKLLPIFLIIKFASNDECPPEKQECYEVLKILRHIYEQDPVNLKRGRMVMVESTPFGNLLFYNSVSEGIVSSLVGPGNCLVLTDARTTLGCEGGPIYLLIDRNKKTLAALAGMVVCSLSWSRGEWVGFTLGVNLKAAVHHCILEMGTTCSISPPELSSNAVDVLAFVDECLVLIRCGTGWGTGIVIDAHKGIILTCSHVVRKAENNVVQIFWKNLKKQAKLLFRSRDGIAYDAAILYVEPGIPFKSAHIGSTIPKKGDLAIAAGFQLFSGDDNNRPTVTRGIVSHVSHPIAMLQTTCCVQSGASGGAIFWSTGELMGLISCNTQNMASGALYPHVSMAIPICVLEANLVDFIHTGDVRHLKCLESPDPVIQLIWKLQSLHSKL